MGEKDKKDNKEEKKAAVDVGEKVAADGGAKKQDEPITVVLKLELHCEGCAKKVRRSINHLKGVEKVKSDCKAKKLIVTGNVDPTWLREEVETKTKKKVELISPQPQKDAPAPAPAGGDKKKADEEEKKTEENKAADDDDDKKPKEEAGGVSSVVMKTKLHCEDCANKIKRIIFKNFEGVESVKTDLDKDLMMVRGKVEAEKLVTYLREKLKRGVEIITVLVNPAAAAKDEEEKSRSGEEAAKVEVINTTTTSNKMEHHSINSSSINNNNSQTHFAMPMPPMPVYNHGMYEDHPPSSHSQHPHVHGYGPPLLPPPPTYLMNSTESDDNYMFSDENPNGCSIT